MTTKLIYTLFLLRFSYQELKKKEKIQYKVTKYQKLLKIECLTN
jgi:hypothetical protein